MITHHYPGLVCASRYTEDEQWYRAIILTVDKANSEAEVFYVDWANKEPCVKFSDLRLLDDIFFDEPILATPFSLHSVSS